MYDVSMSPSAISESISESMSENMSENIQKKKNRQHVLVDNLLRTSPSRDLWPLGKEGIGSWRPAEKFPNVLRRTCYCSARIDLWNFQLFDRSLNCSYRDSNEWVE